MCSSDKAYNLVSVTPLPQLIVSPLLWNGLDIQGQDILRVKLLGMFLMFLLSVYLEFPDSGE